MTEDIVPMPRHTSSPREWKSCSIPSTPSAKLAQVLSQALRQGCVQIVLSQAHHGVSLVYSLGEPAVAVTK